MLETTLAICTILGGIAAIGYFIENARKRRKSHIKKLNKNIFKSDKLLPYELLIVEDDGSDLEHLTEQFKDYEDQLKISAAKNAQEAIECFDEKTPDAIILDIMLPYGDQEEILDKKTDPDLIYTGIRLFELFLKKKKESNKQFWCALVTARSPSSSSITELTKKLDGIGKIYFKPYDRFLLEHDLVSALGLDSKVPDYIKEAINK